MRILLDYRPALRERTGVGEYVHELARALSRTADADEVALLSASWKDRPSPGLRDELPGIRIVDRRLPVRGLTWAWNRLGWPPVEWLAGDWDIVHAHTLLIPARRAAQIVTIHDLHFLEHPERGEAEMRRDFPSLVRSHAHRADHVIVPSHYMAREVSRRLDVPPDRVSVCPHGAPDWAAAIANTRHTTLGTPGTLGTLGTPILFLGTLEPRKNIAGLLDAYERLLARRSDTPRLVLAGRARASMHAQLARLASPPLAGHVSVLGYVTTADRQRLYRDARMLVLPSREEGFGLPVLEAMAAGVPVVVSNRGALPEVAGDAASPVDPDDAEALAQAMDQLLDPVAARDAILRGTRQALRYSWDACAHATREAYRHALAARARRAA